MAKACVYAPKRGTELFYKLKKLYGYEKAWDIYGIAISSRFQNNNKSTLSLDKEGVPSFESLMNNSYIKNFIGKSGEVKNLQQQYPAVEDTLDNYKLALEQAKNFNKNNSNFIATIEYKDDKLQVTIAERNSELEEKFKNQYASFKLNERLANILTKQGITIGNLTEVETKAGRVGVTDLSAANRIAHNAVQLIRIANNMEGHGAISEEFSHVLIASMRNSPLVQRALSKLMNENTAKVIIGEEEYNKLVEFYGDRPDVQELIAEEALGQLLEKNLLDHELNTGDTLFDRLVKHIRAEYKDADADAIIEAIHEANTIASELAKTVNDNMSISLSEAKHREVQFNKLSDKVEANMQILKDAVATEAKRKLITANLEVKGKASALVENLQNLMIDGDPISGIVTYAQNVLEDFKSAQNSLSNIDSSDLNTAFNTLRRVRTILQSYAPFINSMNKLALEEKEDLQNVTDDKGLMTLYDMINSMNSLSNQLGVLYMEKAVPSFAAFIKPILGDKIQLKMNDADSVRTIEEMLNTAEGDISLLDRWLDGMGDSSDILLRTFDKVVKNAKDKARMQSLKEIKQIQTLMLEAEKAGITSFDWIYEKDSEGNLTGNYVSEYNVGQYLKDEKAMRESLDKKYGINPSGEEAKKKIAERRNWYNTHSRMIIVGVNKRVRKPGVMYKNSAYSSIMNNSTKAKLFKDIMSLKTAMDKRYNSGNIYSNRAIQCRKDGVQRFMDSMSSASNILTQIKENIKAEIVEKPDDDQIFGNNSRKGLTDFSGREFLSLPKLYTTRLENPNELSTDIFKSLMLYSISSNEYQQLDNIVDALETGRVLASENRKTKVTRGSMPIQERFNSMGMSFINNIFTPVGSTNMDAKLNDFFESQIYGKYLKDSGYAEVFGNKVNYNKLTSVVLKCTSLAQMGFNFLANIANVTTGIGMQNIEAAANQYFSVKDLASADATYTSLLPALTAEMGSRIKTNKLSLFDELFDVKQDFKNASSQTKSWVRLILGERLAYLGQDCGDHWLYNRTAIAMAKKEHLFKNGKDMGSVWDNLKTREAGAAKEMYVEEGYTYKDGREFTATDFARKIAHVNQRLFGIYNQDDQNAAKRVILGRMCLQYRNWIKPQFNARFMKGQFNLDTHTWEEGYFRTCGRLIADCVKAGNVAVLNWDKLNETEKSNVVRALTEVLQYAAVWMLANLVQWPDDKDRPWCTQMAEYLAKRSEHELGNLCPSLTMANEILTTVQKPAACLSAVQATSNFLWACVYPPMWNNEKQSGTFEGHSDLYARFFKLPLPGISQYRSMDRFLNDLDNSIQFYSRASY